MQQEQAPILLLRWQRKVAEVEFSLINGGYLSLTLLSQ